MGQKISEAQMNQNAYDVGIHMRNQGWNFKAICALLGNMQAESGINPDREQDLYEPYSGGGPGFGLVQFDGSTYPLVGGLVSFGRTYMKRLCKWVTGSESGYNTVLKQCQIINYVMYNGQYISTGAYPQSADEFKKWSGSLEEAVYAFLRNFERAGIEHAQTRVQFAQAWYNNLKLDEAPPADKNPVTPTTPDNPQGGESKDSTDEVSGHWESIIQKIKWSLDEGYYFVDGNTLRSSNSEFSMTRYGNTYLLFLDEKEKKKFVEDKISESMNGGGDNPSTKPSPNPPSGAGTGGQVIANSFIHELNLMVNHKPHIYYANVRPQPNPISCGYADCSGFIGYGLRNIHPSVWANGNCNTGTIHQMFSGNGYMIWGVGSRLNIPWDKLKPGDIINFGTEPSLGAGLQSHIICYGNNGQIIDCNGSGGVQIRDNCRNIVENYYTHAYAAVYRIYK